MRRFLLLTTVALLTVLLASCGDDDGGRSGVPLVVVTTNILGDVVENLTDGAVEVKVLMPVGADPHQFQLSARQVAEVGQADALVVNGGGFEAAMVDVIDAAESDGVRVIAALDAFDRADDAHLDSEHDHGDHHHGADHDGHGRDPHFFTVASHMAVAVEHIAADLEAATGVDVSEPAAAYATELRDLDDEVTDLLAPIPAADRVLVTNHDVLGWFADFHGFRVVGTVIPTGSTSDAASAGVLSELADTIEAEGVPAVFVDASAPTGLAEALADEVTAVEIVELYTESLGDADGDGATYVDMILTNARRIAHALT